MEVKENRLLFLAGMGSFFVAFLHIIIMYVGAPAYRYFGAGEEMASLAESGSLQPVIITTAITVLFMLFALYAFSGMNLIFRLPFVKQVLLLVGVLFTLRGAAAAFFVYLLVSTGSGEWIKDIVFSLVALSIGLMYLIGRQELVKKNELAH